MGKYESLRLYFIYGAITGLKVLDQSFTDIES